MLSQQAFWAKAEAWDSYIETSTIKNRSIHYGTRLSATQLEIRKKRPYQIRPFPTCQFIRL